eukprot:m.210220 g.210220  ORF g.210220 m.210220 type:complete len:63 (-) comp15049_c2_seq1:2905-3093(-)
MLTAVHVNQLEHPSHILHITRAYPHKRFVITYCTHACMSEVHSIVCESTLAHNNINYHCACV